MSVWESSGNEAALTPCSSASTRLTPALAWPSARGTATSTRGLTCERLTADWQNSGRESLITHAASTSPIVASRKMNIVKQVYAPATAFGKLTAATNAPTLFAALPRRWLNEFGQT